MTRVGSAVQLIGVAPNPFLAQVGLRVEPLPAGAGVEFALEIEFGSMPSPSSPRSAKVSQRRRGGRPRLGHSGRPGCDDALRLLPRQSHAHATFDKAKSSTEQDFRSLTPLVLAEALTRAGTIVCAPIRRFELEIPEDTLSAVLSELSRHHAVPLETAVRGRSGLLAGALPADAIYVVQQRIPPLTRGEGIFTSGLDHYAPTTWPPPILGRPSQTRSPNR